MSDTPTFQNAIWILGDQHPAHALSCNGDPNLNTRYRAERRRLHERLDA